MANEFIIRKGYKSLYSSEITGSLDVSVSVHATDVFVSGHGSVSASLSSIVANDLDGSGTANYISKFSDTDTLTDSSISDDGSTINLFANTTGNTGVVNIYGEGGVPPTLQVSSRTNRAKLKIADNDTAINIIAEGSIGSFGFGSTSSATNNISILSTGRVGIGVIASTNAMLDVRGPDTDNAVLGRFWSNTGARGSFIIRNGSGVNPTTFIGTAGGSEQLSIGTNNTEAIRIDASQKVGIGITNPLHPLHVVGTISGSDTYINGWNSVSGSLYNITTTHTDFSASVSTRFEGLTTDYTELDNIPDNIISSSAQVNHDQTTNFVAGEHFLQSAITTVGTVTAGNINAILPANTVSSSAQIASDISGSITSFSGSIAGRVETNESSIASLNGATGSYLLNTTDTLTGNLTVTGTLTAQEFHTEFVSASILFDSGSTKFGDSSDDVHSFTGSLQISGSGITVKDPGTPVINLIDETNDLSLKFRSANNYGYIDLDAGNSVGSSRLLLRTDGYPFLYGNQNHDVYIPSGSLIIGTETLTGKFNSYISATRQLTHNGNGGDLSIISDNNSAPVLFVKGTGTADLVNIYDNTTEVFTILDGGNVGIGTTNPASPLHLSMTDGDIRMQSETSRNHILSRNSDDSSWRNLAISAISGQKQLVLNTDGNVGIGTTSPGSKLTVDGDARLSNGGKLYLWNDHNANYLDYRTWTASSSAGMTISNTAANGDILLIPNGNVGIGTTSPQSKLHIKTGSGGTYSPNVNHDDLTIEGSGNIGLQLFSPATSYQYIAFGDPGSVNAGYLRYYHGTNKLVFRTNGSDNMVIDDNGNVGIGTTSPGSRLTVSGTDNATSEITLINTNPSTDNDWSITPFYNDQTLRFRTNSAATTVMTLKDNGNVGIGTTSPSAKLEVNGVAVVRGGSFSTPNDTRTDVGLVIAEEDFIYTLDGSSDYLRRLIGKASDIIQIGEPGTSLIDGINLKPGTTGGYVQIFNNASVAAKFVDGKLGIGTTSPTIKFEVVGDGTGNSGIGFKQSGAQEHRLYAANQVQHNAIGSSAPIWKWGQSDATGSIASQKMLLNNSGLTVTGDIDSDDITIDGWGSVSSSLASIATAGGVNGSGTTNDLVMWSGANSISDAPIAISGNNATFSGDVLLSAAGTTGEIIRTTDNTEPYFALQRNSGANGVGVLRLLDGGDLAFDTGATGAGQTTRLTIDGATGNATFAGSITTNLSSEGTYFTGGSGGIRQLSITSGTNTSAHALHTFNIASTNGKYELNVNGTTEFSLDSSNATFTGNISASNLSGTNTGDQDLSGYAQGDLSDYLPLTAGSTKPLTGDLYIEEDSLYLLNASSNYWRVQNNSSGKLVFKQGTTQRGIWSSGELQLANNLIVDGNVGIGTTSPNVPLEIHGADIATTSTTTSTSVLRLVRDVVDSSFPNRKNSAVDFMLSRQQTVNNNLPYTRLDIRLAGTTDSSTPSLDVMSLLHNGNVGVGTTSPGEKLVVDGKIRSLGGTSSADFYSTGNDALIVNNGTQNLKFWNNGSERMRIKGDGKVGIGTTSPTDKLHVEGGIVIQNGNNLQWGGLYSAAAPTIYASTNYLAFVPTGNTGAAARGMRLTATGLGIGTSVPSQKLEVSGTIKSTSTGAAHLILNGDSNNTGDVGEVDSIIDFLGDGDPGIYGYRINTENYSGQTALHFQEYLNGSYTSRLYINKDGNVGIGTTSPTAAKLVVDSSTAPQILVKNTAGGNAKILFEDNSGLTQNASITFDQSAQNTLTIATGYQSSTDLNRINIAPAGDVGLTVRGGTGSSSGNVGIGTTSPSAELEVNVGLNSLKISGRDTYIDSSIDSTNANIYVTQDGVGDFSQLAGSLVLQARTHGTVYRDIIFAGGITNGDALMTILGEGRVGIGTTSPTSKIHVIGQDATFYSGTSNQSLQVGRNAQERLETFVNDTDIKLTAYQDSDSNGGHGFIIDRSFAGSGANYFDIRKDGTAQMRINKDGNVGIGTTVPDARLHVDSVTAFSLTDGSADTLLLTNDSTTSTIGAIGPSIGFGNMNSNRRTSAIAAVRTGDDHDNMGLAFFTHPSDSNDETVEQKMTINHAGNVGIGATDPLRKLHVVGNMAINAGTDEYYGILMQGGESANPSILIGDWHNSSGTIKWDSSGNYLRIDSQHATANAAILFSGNDATTEYMRIASTGNVGIGTSNVTEKLVVDGNVKVKGNIIGVEAGTIIKDVITDQSYEGTAFYNPETLNAFAGADKWATISVTNAKESNRTSALTSLGAAPFNVLGNTIQVYFDTSETEIVIEIDHTTNPLRYHGVVGIQFTAGAWIAARVKFEGYNGTAWTTGLDTTTNTDTTVSSKIDLSSAGIQKTRITLGDPNNSSGGYMRISKIFGYDYKGVSSANDYQSGTYYISRYENSAHYSNVYPATDNTYSLGTSGLKYANIYAGVLTATSIVETSAKRFKENIKSLESQTDKLQKLKPVSFDWKENSKADVGFIAEEVKEIYPELVSEEDGETQGIQYSKLTAILVKAVQDQQKQIDELKEEIFILKKK